MDTTKENLEEIHSQKVESAAALNQINGLLDLLVELKIIDQNESPELDLKPSSLEETGGEIEAWKNLFQSPQMLALPPAKEIGVPSLHGSDAGNADEEISPLPTLIERSQETWNHQSYAHVGENNLNQTPEIDEDRSIELISQLFLVGGSTTSKENLENENALGENQAEIAAIGEEEPEIEDDPFKRLQDILVQPEVSEVRELVAYVDQKVANLEHQIYEPSELINLLLPWIAELLSRKVDESKDEVIGAIAPIIDQIIESRTEQDREAMSAALAPLIAAAITQQINNAPEEVAQAIGPTMGKAIKEQIALERDAMVDALYPVIGSTVARYIAEAIRDINEKVANAFSVQGVSRKIRAKVQGVSEGELIFKESIPFTVQAIFLIHKTSGLVISEVQMSGEQKLEADMVAGMLTAIRSFVNDCIAQTGEISELDAIDYGNSKIILEVAGYCYLAIVITGDPPKSFIKQVRQTLSTIIIKYGKAIESFDGDPANVPAPVRSMLDKLIETPSKQKAAKPPVALIGISLAALSLVLVPWGIFAYRNSIDRRIEANAAEALASAPQLAVYRLNVKADGDTLRLSGKLPTEYLRQKAEKIARDSAPNLKLYNEIFAVEVPPDPVLAGAEVKRVTSVLNQTNGIAIAAQYNAGKVTLSGTVNSFTDAQKITQAFAQIPGVTSVTNTVQIQPFKIDARIYFELGSAELTFPDAGDKINQVKDILTKNTGINLKIIGHSDRTGTLPENQRLSLERARTVRDALIRAGIAPKRLLIAGTAQPPLDVDPEREAARSRVVRFEALTPEPAKTK
ncbi:OmpA family protein [Microseira sp. BLCC-F43]|uniref:OmpA family protein n=1 Tax=Microseira sp. BLCC-F43 TaxID=3153602 RepID=UPI0035B798AA